MDGELACKWESLSLPVLIKLGNNWADCVSHVVPFRCTLEPKLVPPVIAGGVDVFLTLPL